MILTTLDEIAAECQFQLIIAKSIPHVIKSDGADGTHFFRCLSSKEGETDLCPIIQSFLEENGFKASLIQTPMKHVGTGVYYKHWERKNRYIRGFLQYQSLCLSDSGELIPIDHEFNQAMGTEKTWVGGTMGTYDLSQIVNVLDNNLTGETYYFWYEAICGSKLVTYELGFVQTEDDEITGEIVDSDDPDVGWNNWDMKTNAERMFAMLEDQGYIAEESILDRLKAMYQAIDTLCRQKLIRWDYDADSFVDFNSLACPSDMEGNVKTLTPVHQKWLQSKGFYLDFDETWNEVTIKTNVLISCEVDDMNVYEQVGVPHVPADVVIGRMMANELTFIAADGQTVWNPCSSETHHVLPLKEWLLHRFMMDWNIHDPFDYTDHWQGTLLQFSFITNGGEDGNPND